MKTTRNIDSIENGIIIDHIQVGNGMKIYDLLHLDALECTVVLIRNARSSRYGRKDVIKIEGEIRLDLDLLGYVDHHVTVCFVHNGEIVEKKKLTLPHRLTNVIRCKNPRCICTIEEGIDHVFELTPNKTYRCIYCENPAKT